jgi:long-subunit acyl-CoA synthetase (AMP-forming)
LDRCRVFVTGAAPVSIETLESLASFGIPIYELYGMSESSGGCTINYVDANVPGSVGRVLPGVELKLQHVPGRDNEGEGGILYSSQ